MRGIRNSFPLVSLLTFVCFWSVLDRCLGEQFNVLFVAIDDLRPALGCYGDDVAITPNIDRLAGRAMVFNRAYCQQAVCSPSRLSVMTGLRPDTIQVWDLKTHFREAVRNAVTLPQHFKNHGYHTQSIGKIYHGSGRASKDAASWSAEPQFDYVREPKLRYALPQNLVGQGLKRSSSEAADVADSHYVDGLVCRTAVKTLGELRDIPFFLAVGFRKPHLPFCAPRRYWDLYDQADIPLPVSSEHPSGAPELATRSWMELEGYTDIAEIMPEVAKRHSAEALHLPESKMRELRHGYYACVSYVDSLVGRLLDTLQELKLADKTIVVLWGDHGFHLGEQGLWTKANNYELATRVPLIMAVPGVTTTGSTTQALVELVDVYPTLADVCGLVQPPSLEGSSLRPLLDTPDRSWKRAAFSQYPRDRKSNRHQGNGDIMGYAIRTERHRYVEWQDSRTKNVIATELYDVRSDPNETQNLAHHPQHLAVAKRLSRTLEAGWQAAMPPAQDLP